ncbi:NAD(P)H-binding protein [Tenggerimyces flavus]|uniref:NAD(P)H-binding protein n=1 Tax=Tenggerimyces flavus TaxID=1708749 RepID=A0ABV7YN67_9ACTN|nr:NAD(P)H-binding protein [Tenggerimyces flavus]MBM7784656.1 uncharacterized protein YbjT (DUF2867 family) [Tenggerimyces flavus]
MSTTLVIGATGHVGRPLVAELSSRQVAVRALVRRPDAAGLPAGVELVAGDLADLASVSAAAAGVDRVFLVWPFTTSEGFGAVLDALGSDVRRLVYLSSAGSVPFHDEVEALIAQSGLSWTFLRPSGFAVNTLGWAAGIQAGEVRLPYGAAARPLIDERDTAAVGVRALLEPGHAGKVHELSGPVALTQVEQVSTIASVLGREVRFVELTPEEGRAMFRAAWGDSPYVDGAIAGLAQWVHTPERTTTTVADILGRPAIPFRAWVEANAPRFGAQEA